MMGGGPDPMPGKGSLAAGPTRRIRVLVSGTVQGVGFRPHVFLSAGRYGLGGWVRNTPDGVEIEAEGPAPMLERFIRELAASPPRMAKIAEFIVEESVPAGEREFTILPSRAQSGNGLAAIPADIATCPECRLEIERRGNRRYGYAFTNCASCGPRYTILTGLPYDRDSTTMRRFRMCEDCRREYTDRSDRRFHAQPVACPVCGPRVFWADGRGKLLSEEAQRDWAGEFRRRMRAGQIAAIKGLGGYHLVCDARNEEAIARLRQVKNRPAKPLAVLCRDLEVVGEYCLFNEDEEGLLHSAAAPIVLLARRPQSRPIWKRSA